MPTLLPALAPWVVPTALGALALLLSTVLVVLTRRRRLAAIPLLDEVDPDLAPGAGADPGAERPRPDRADRTAPATTSRPSLEGWDGALLPSTRVRAGAPDPATGTTWHGGPDGHPEVAPPVGSSADGTAGSGAGPTTGPTLESTTESSTEQWTGQVAEPGVEPGPAEPAPVLEGPPTAYVALSRELAATGDVTGAVLAQWAADLQVLGPALGAHGPDLARAVDAVRHEDPVTALRTCREAALGLVRAAGPVRALLAPLDHLLEASGSAPSTPAAHPPAPPVLPPELLALLPADQRRRLTAATPSGEGLTA